MLLFIIVHHYS